MKHLLFIVLLAFTLFSSCKKEETNPMNIWLENIGSRTDLPFLPEGNVNYYMYSFKRNTTDKIGLRITADFPFARYMSYNIYDNRDRSSITSIIDKEIVADIGSINPFRSSEIASNRKYTIYILPDIPEAASYPNSLKFNSKIPNLCTMLRLYVPETDKYGGVGLPNIEAFDLTTGKTVDLPKPLNIDFNTFKDQAQGFESVIGLTFLLQKGNNIDFFRFSGAKLYQNFDNQYVFAPVTLGGDQVALLKVKAPQYAKDLSQINDAEMRYFSFCIGDAATYNYATLGDFQCKIASDGYIYLVIAREDAAIQAKAEGLNFITWHPALKNEGLIIYRNLLTRADYPYNMKLVPDLVENLDKVLDTDFLKASIYLGDNVPQGKKMTKAEFLENFGGMEVAY